MRTTPRLCTRLIGLACVAVASNAAAQVSDQGDELIPYRVEVLVFRNLATVTDNEDPGRPPLPPESIVESDLFLDTDSGNAGSDVVNSIDEEEAQASENSQSETPAVEESTSLFFAPSDIFQLDEAANRIRGSRGFRLLLHESWIQPGFPAEGSQAVDLLVLEQIRRLGPLTDDSGHQEPIRAPQPAPESLVHDPELPPLSGTMTLHRSRYLHLSVDISFLTEDGVRFEIHERRRMRSSELHYLDSPGLGVIALVIPIEDQQP
jgi:hypothetical protein